MAKSTSSFWELDGKLEASPGSSIHDAIPEAIQIARERGEAFSFDFNGVTVIVEGTSDAALIFRDWDRALRHCIESPVGPFPSATLTDVELAHDVEVEAQNQARRDAAHAEYQRKADAKKAATDARLANAPAFAASDPEAWRTFDEKNRDPYGHGVVVFAEQWARLMQLDMANGAKLEDIADAASSEADTEGITGFMYGCAVSVLSQCWQHGEALRRWHNLKTQIRDDGVRANETGGVLNPALLNIG